MSTVRWCVNERLPGQPAISRSLSVYAAISLVLLPLCVTGLKYNNVRLLTLPQTMRYKNEQSTQNC